MFIHNTPTRTNQTQKREGQHLAHVTASSFSCSLHATRAALTDTVQTSLFRVAIPRVN